jgi:transcriptional regulator with XRE-family HTH domain
VRRASEDAALTRAFGSQVRAARERLGVSQEKLAFRCGFHRTYLGGIERGELNPSLYSVARLAAGLGLSVSELVSGLPPVEPPPSPLLR